MSGLTKAQVLYVSAQKEFSGRQSDRQEVDLLERDTFHRKNAVRLKRREQPQGMGSSWKVRAAPKYGVVTFYGLGNFIG